MKLLRIKNILWKSIKSLANLNFSIFTLLLISFCIMLGSIIEQDQSINYYQNYYPIYTNTLNFINWKFIIFLGLDHLYQTWWFILVLNIFALSLTICTFSVQLPSLKNARRWKFFHNIKRINSDNQIHNLFDETSNSYINMIYSLVYYNFYVFHKKYHIYAYKGLIGRIAPIFVHISIIITLFGSVCSLFLGYTAQEMIVNGELFHVKNIIHSGFYSNLDTNFVCKIDDFFIDYNKDRSIKQFFSKLSLLNNRGQLIINKIISVNSPLKFKGFTFYQTDWNIDSLRLKVGASNKQIIQKKLISININNKPCWLCKLPIDIDKQIFIVVFDLKDKIFIFDIDGSIIDSILINESLYLNDTSISIQNIMLDTGLQIKIDPGVQIIYLGFFILMFSTIISYISYSQIWICIICNVLNFSGSTNRAIFFFEEDIAKINTIYRSYTFIKN
uniref:Cytochrome c biogenesis protein CcsB n=1 Tax=Cumathamnion serrulatum TaxID=1206573 RepID=A0A7U1G3T4_9FLOR|nr:cytochrome c biogenesis protein ccs1 [Cumathamnion serrulatum]QQY85265.1 cytochrome c biogenesis protein ccs1 [Cumathamnion serrulatum]